MLIRQLAFRYLRPGLLLFGVAWPVLIQAAMTSTNYTIYADSVGYGGGLGTSTNYNLVETLGGSPAGLVTSTSYTVRGGFQSQERDDLSISVLPTTLDLGSLSDSTVRSASTNVTVTSYALTGYTLSVDSISGTALAAVADGSVTAGSEEYGFSAAGSDVAFSGDVAVAAGRVIASSNAPAYSVVSALTFKAAESLLTVAGTYSQSVTLTVSANF